ncbi:hypothetical protein Thiowin_03127 [Thiorhodovibrio winogradskyi]|uniref:Uncharacterized protein n=1 Tax=Thiorhodovibrio winogradskyi TaxID=77007 RepID=A0ABZ0SD81_9GAMM
MSHRSIQRKLVGGDFITPEPGESLSDRLHRGQCAEGEYIRPYASSRCEMVGGKCISCWPLPAAIMG